MSKTALPHLASRVFGTPLLIARRKLDAIMYVLGPRLGVVSPDMLFDPGDDPDGDGDEDDSPSYTVTPEGIAIISVSGPLVRKSSFIDDVCGITSYAQIENQIIGAITDPAVTGLLLDVDSPGGEAAGCFDLADQLYSLRGQKPIYAIANDDCYSAAYALASAADTLFVTRTGGVGSIGVIALHLDQSEADKQDGLKYTAIYAGDHKNDFSPHEPLSDYALKTEQAEINRLYSMFVGTVSRNRGMNAEDIKRTQAALFFGPDGVSSGLADRLGTAADALAAVTEASRPIAASRPQPIFSIASASAAAISPKGEVMADQNNAADQHPAVQPQATAPPTPAFTTEQAEEIIELCALAGRDLKTASAYIAKRMSPAQVRKELATQREQESESTVVTSAVTSGMSTSATSGQADIMLSIADGMAKTAEARKVRGY